MTALALLAVLALADPPAPAAAHAPTPPAATDPAGAANRLFERAIAAVGPVERVPFLRATGRIEHGEDRSAIEVLWNARAPRRIVVRERLADGRVNETGCDGERGWMRVAGRESALELEPAAALATAAPLVPSLMVMAVADRFPSRTLGPIEPQDGVSCQRVDLEDRDGLPGAAWFETATGRLRAFRTRASRTASPVVTSIESWAAAGPLTVPACIVSRGSGPAVRTAFVSIETTPIPDADFRAPLPRAPRE